MSKQITIDVELPIDFRDAGPWRSYQLTATGSTWAELMESAGVSEIDQDGGELATYSIDDAPSNEIERVAKGLLAFEIAKAWGQK